MRVLLVTSDKQHCGIKEYGEYLMQAMRERHPEVVYTVAPQDLVTQPPLAAEEKFDLVHLNHHAAIHAAWTPSQIAVMPESPFLVTQHDTFETRAIMDERGLPDFSKVAVVVTHEPVAGYGPRNVYEIRQGVLGKSPGPARAVRMMRIGTVGFDFPWKNFDTIAQIAGELGLAFMIVSPGMSEERMHELSDAYGGTRIFRDWLPAAEVVELLSGNFANLFLYTCGNSGTSGAIRMGLAARRPVLAYKGCRQFRDLERFSSSGPIFGKDRDSIIAILKTMQESAWLEGAAVDSAVAHADANSWGYVADSYHTLYSRAIGARGY